MNTEERDLLEAEIRENILMVLELHKETKLNQTLSSKAAKSLDSEKTKRAIVVAGAGAAFVKATEGTTVGKVLKAGEKAVKDAKVIGKEIGKDVFKKASNGELKDLGNLAEIKDAAIKKIQKLEGVRLSDAPTQPLTPKGSVSSNSTANPDRILGENQFNSSDQKNELSPYEITFLSSLSSATELSVKINPNMSSLRNDLTAFDSSQYSIATKLNLEQLPNGSLSDYGMSKGMNMFDLITLNTTAKTIKPSTEYHLSIGANNPYDHADVLKSEAAAADVGVGLCIAAGLTAIAFGKAVKDIPFGKLIQKERELTEMTSNEQFRKELISFAELPSSTTEEELGRRLDRMIFDDTDISGIDDWMILLNNLQDTHIKRSLVKCLPFDNKNTRTPEQLELIQDTQKMLLTYMAESKRDDNLKGEVADSIKHSIAIADAIVDEYKKDPKKFEENHKEVYETIYRAVPSNKFSDKSKMFIGMEKNDLLFKGRVVAAVAKKLSRVKNRGNGIGKSHVQFGKELQQILSGVEEPNQETEYAKKSILMVNAYVKDMNNQAKKKKNKSKHMHR